MIEFNVIIILTYSKQYRVELFSLKHKRNIWNYAQSVLSFIRLSLGILKYITAKNVWPYFFSTDITPTMLLQSQVNSINSRRTFLFFCHQNGFLNRGKGCNFKLHKRSFYFKQVFLFSKTEPKCEIEAKELLSSVLLCFLTAELFADILQGRSICRALWDYYKISGTALDVPWIWNAGWCAI